MSRSLRLHPAAQRELDEAAAYYDAESPGLGSAFLSEVDHALQQVRAFPEAAPSASGRCASASLSRFPTRCTTRYWAMPSSCSPSRITAGGRSTGVTGSRPVGGADKRIKLMRRRSSSHWERRAHSLSAVRSAWQAQRLSFAGRGSMLLVMSQER